VAQSKKKLNSAMNTVLLKEKQKYCYRHKLAAMWHACTTHSQHSNHTIFKLLPDLDGNILADQDTLRVVQTAVDSVVQKVAQEVLHIQYVPGNQGAEQAPCIYCKGLVLYLAACLEMAGW